MKYFVIIKFFFTKHILSIFKVLFNVFILVYLVFNLKFNFKLKIDPKMRTFKNFEEI